MSVKSDHYVPLTSEEWQAQVKYLTSVIEVFVDTNHYEPSYIFLNENILFQVISRVNQRKQYFNFFHDLDMSDFKELALTCFWIIKLKPLSLQQRELEVNKRLEYISINEQFAIFYIIKVFRSLATTNNKPQEVIDQFFDEKYIYELIYSFMHRDISKEALILLIETIAKSLGYDPYRDAK